MKILYAAPLAVILLSSSVCAHPISVRTIHEDDDLIVRRGEIHIEDLDLRYEVGRHALDRRLQGAARRVCAEQNITGLPDFDDNCYRDVLAQGRMQGDRLIKAALRKSYAPRLSAIAAVPENDPN